MKYRTCLAAGLLVVLLAGSTISWSHFKPAAPGATMTAAAREYLLSLDEDQRATSLMGYDTPKRVDWHFIPKAERKGLQVKHMKSPQRKAAHALLRACLSEIGYDKAVQIMALEGLLRELEKERTGGPVRDPQRYYFTLFGEPTADGKWGLSIEGHHLSLNFVVEKGKVVSTTPTFLAANPGVVMSQVPGTTIKKGTRVLAKEEMLAFELLGSLSEAQRADAVIADKAPREIRAAGAPQPPREKAVGLAARAMSDKQRKVLMQLIESYANNLPSKLAGERLAAIKQAGAGKVKFAWAGADKPGIGHYYRVQGPTFLIEFVNTQPDAAGNPANHIHCVWRDMAGDFALGIASGA